MDGILRKENVSQSDIAIISKYNILVVDDDTASLTIIRTILQNLGYQVMTVESADHALSTLRNPQLKFDLVLMDLHITDTNGFGLQKTINQEFRLPVVLMSADGNLNDQLKGLLNGAVYFMKKPLFVRDLEFLYQYVEQWKRKLAGEP